MTGIVSELHQAFAADLELVAGEHRLSNGERAELARIVAGAVPGNRDRPLFLLALRICAIGSDDLLSMILPGEGRLNRKDRALLDFLVTAGMDTPDGIGMLVGALPSARRTADPAQGLASVLSSVLHAYRARVLPESRHHNVFVAVRRYLATVRPEDPHPRDGDAPRFWEAEGRRDLLTRYVTALHALSDYAEAEILARTWRHPVALDGLDSFAAPIADSDSWHGADDPLRNRLADGLEALATAPVKLLLSYERENLADLAEFAEIITRWPGDVVAALTMGPIQAVLTQASRQRGNGADVAAAMQRAQTCDEVIARIEALATSLNACLHLIQRAQPTASEMAPARSSLSQDDVRRVAAMERRQGLASLSSEERTEILTELIEPVLLCRSMLDRYRRAMRRLGPERSSTLEQEHRVLFGRKLASLYGATAEG